MGKKKKKIKKIYKVGRVVPLMYEMAKNCKFHVEHDTFLFSLFKIAKISFRN